MPSGGTWQSLMTFLVVTTRGWGATVISWTDAKDAAQDGPTAGKDMARAGSRSHACLGIAPS